MLTRNTRNISIYNMQLEASKAGGKLLFFLFSKSFSSYLGSAANSKPVEPSLTG